MYDYNSNAALIIRELSEYQSQHRNNGLNDFAKVYETAAARVSNDSEVVERLLLESKYEARVFKAILEDFNNENLENKVVSHREYYMFRSNLEDIFRRLI